MKRKFFTKTTLLLGIVTLTTLPIIGVVSCLSNEKQKQDEIVANDENDFEIDENGYIYSFNKKDEKPKKIVIPKKIKGIVVRGIVGWDFNGLRLEEIVFPETLEFIGEYAFQNNKIKNLVLPNSVKEVGQRAFQDAGIETIKLGNNLQKIGESAFDSNQIKELKIPDSLKILPAEAFSKNQIVNLDLGNGVESIGDSCFKDNKIERLTFPKSLEMINFYSFDRNNLQDKLWIPDNVKQICGYSFVHNPNLKYVSLSKDTILGLESMEYPSFDGGVIINKR